MNIQNLNSWIHYQKFSVKAAHILPNNVLNRVSDHITLTPTHTAAYIGGVILLILILLLIIGFKIRNCLKEYSKN